MRRSCDNCMHGHYSLSANGEELYCDECGYDDGLVNPGDCCGLHEYIPDSDEYTKAINDVISEIEDKPVISKYNGCADSEVIANYVDKIEYDENKTEEVLKRFDSSLKRSLKRDN